jgi:PAS domain S-box-containing protein
MDSEPAENVPSEERMIAHTLQDIPPIDEIINVLHVDDEPAILETAKHFIEMYEPHICIQSVVSPERALEILEKQSFNCIVSDYQMPGMNGLEFASEVLKNRRIPFILYTGKGNENIVDAALAIGVNDYISKEVPPSHFRQLVKSIIIVVAKHRTEERLFEFEKKHKNNFENERNKSSIGSSSMRAHDEITDETWERKLSNSEERYQKLIELAPDGIITFNLKGFVTSINPAYTKLTGFSEEEIVNKHFTQMSAVKVADIPRYMNIFSSILLGRKLASIEFEFNKKDGSTGWGEAHFSLYRYKDKKRGFIAIARDITDRKQITEKLKVVGTLTQHDIRNQLSAIIGYLDIINMNLREGRPIETYMEKIRNTTYRTVNLLNFATDFERYGNEKKRSIPVSKSFKKALSSFNLGGITVVDRCEELVVQADSLLHRVFYTFIDNTLKHGGEVSEIILYTEKNGILKIIYQDDGIGISDKKKRTILNDDIEKTGAHGLTLISRIIKSYGWTIKEEGELGKGVKFVITLPEMV